MVTEEKLSMDYWIHPNPGTRIKEELLKLNVTVPKHDLGLFMYQYTGSPHGILVTHVDDFFMERITFLLRILSNH